MYDEEGEANEVGEELTGEDFFDASSLAIKCLIIELFNGLIFVQETSSKFYTSFFLGPVYKAKTCVG